MPKSVKAELKAIISELEKREASGANPEAMKVLYEIVEVMNILDIRLQTIERETGYSDVFVSDQDTPHRLR